MPGKRGTLAERLDRHLDKSGECWVWQGCRIDGKYGRISKDGVRLYTHRVAWELANGPIPEGMFVLHSCDNPPCCRPVHLHLGTQLDNMRERDERGRNGGYKCRGERSVKAKLTREQVLEIRARRDTERISYSRLGKEYGVGTETIAHIIQRRTWRHI